MTIEDVESYDNDWISILKCDRNVDCEVVRPASTRRHWRMVVMAYNLLSRVKETTDRAIDEIVAEFDELFIYVRG